jgi:hypothetical protein
LVVEGELLRFTLIIGIEWMFRRALSEWTTVTIPYSRIQSVSVSKLWPLRMFTLLFLSAWIALMVWFWGHEAIAPIMTVGFALLLLMIYINVRVKRAVRVAFRGKGRRKLLAFVIRSRPLRRTFIETLERHVSAAQQFHRETSNVGSI